MKILRSFVLIFGIMLLAVPSQVSAMSTPPIYRYREIQVLVGQVNSATTVASIRAVLQQFFDRYALVVTTDCVQDLMFRCQSLTDGDVENFRKMAALMLQEWAKYPPEWTKATDLRYINLIKQYEYLYNGAGQARAAAPHNYLQTMLYDIGYVYDEAYMREVIHHEYDHYFEASHYSDVYHQDVEWASFNPQGFSYGGGGGTCYQPGNSCLTGEHPMDGFVTGYATSGMEEDKAELYAYMFTKEGNDKLQVWLKNDATLAKKYTYYKALIQSVVPQMDDDYFVKIHTGEDQPQVVSTTASKETPSSVPQTTHSGPSPSAMLPFIAIGLICLTSTLLLVGVAVLIWWLVARRRASSTSQRKTTTLQ